MCKEYGEKINKYLIVLLGEKASLHNKSIHYKSIHLSSTIIKMNFCIKKTCIIVAILFVSIFAGCKNSSENIKTSELTGSTGQTTTIANPASENCIKKGWTLEIKTNKHGQYWICFFEDNRQCEEWALLRGACPEGGKKITGYDNDAEIFCAISGGEVEGVGTETPMCKRVDGTLCNAQANFDGECPDSI